MPRRDALVSPAVLKWARESTALTLEAAAHAAGITNPAKLEAAESGERHITFRQLQGLAKAFRLPLRVLYLPEPPNEPDLPVDFRSTEAPTAHSPALIRALRSARQRRAILIELLQEQGVPTPALPAPRTDDGIIRLLTPFFCVPAFSNPGAISVAGSGALTASKKLVERSLPIAIFETRGNLDGIRGCSLFEPPMSLVILNSQDSANARRFTLAHEIAHLVMRESSICDPLDDHNEIERRCNTIAGESMMPQHLLESRLGGRGLPESHITGLAREFRMSHSAVAVRLHQAGLIAQRRLRELLAFYKQQYAAQREALAEVDGGPSHYLMQALRLGSKFTAAVLEGYTDGALSTSQTADLLGVTPSHASIASIQERASAAYDS